MARAKLVLVHGRAQEGKSESHLADEWIEPLRASLGTRAEIFDDVEIRAPYYGDRLVELVESLRDTIPDDIIVRGAEQEVDEHYRFFLGQTLEELRIREGISDQQIAMEAGLEVTERGPQNWRWVLAIVRALDKIPGLDGDLIERALRDVWIYLERRSVRKIINGIVEPALDTDLPVVLVAHSLGSIVAYDIVRERFSGTVTQLLTVGSPLGLRIARKALAPIRYPTTVEHWFNARDSRDVVALYPLTREFFEIDPEITDFSGVKNRTNNNHGISGYLSDPTTVECLYRGLLEAKTSR
ncbi:serine peptidase [Euryhalocaulis caribicus]|uniref:serine peptidase n=1 Tax=Euryhalocaulis caribicus TaxID=1161401 RepID=UPI0003B55CD8|nr:serine peptidase [Euryhalocaulis caribicus]